MIWVENNIPCECGGKLINQPANRKSIDCICDKCFKNIQIKSSSKPYKVNKDKKLKILGAEYKTTLNSINDNENWDLMLIHYDKELNKIKSLKIIKSQNINADNVEIDLSAETLDISMFDEKQVNVNLRN